ncbi:metal ABC transporter permease [Desulfosarcina ovata]|uniref:Manganese ABC transporter permease n=1 Tax=Desulfosarcina ovata subsp. ovata TaxID=2752305 RepID=A0A5K8ADB1_9BACT|nr:metal ABC transporter permease [Desulfosarcina ovata]BBO90612.1 manganese ABC transporter permease [Desulfosarcina ovata subsp. ovata]
MEWTFIDTWIVVVGALSAAACALLGNYLVLRRMSMMGDAISHAVLPGLAIAFLITGSRASLPMLMGAILIGVVTTLLIQGIDRLSGLDRGASMGVVFTTLFAIGLILIRQAADHVDLDPSCVLYGAIELTPLDTVLIFGQDIPQAAVTSGIMLVLNLIFVIVFFKELRITAFDPALATTMGINANIMHYGLMTLVAATTIAAFESVGSILVIAMLIVPGAAAHLITDRLGRVLAISVLFAAASAVLGHMGAITVPRLFGFQDTSTAGMMALATGLLFLLVFLFAPRYGVIGRATNQLRLGLGIIGDDTLGFLYRYHELAPEGAPPVPIAEIKKALKVGSTIRLMIWKLKRKNLILTDGNGLTLTDEGITAGQGLIRSHRLWETYLCDVMGCCDADVHRHAHKFEHVTDPETQQRLSEITGNPGRDPHRRKIP